MPQLTTSSTSLSARYEALLLKWLDAFDRYLALADQPDECPMPTIKAPNGQEVEFNDFWDVACKVIEKLDKLFRAACQKEGRDRPRMRFSQLVPIKTRRFRSGLFGPGGL